LARFGGAFASISSSADGAIFAFDFRTFWRSCAAVVSSSPWSVSAFSDFIRNFIVDRAPQPPFSGMFESRYLFRGYRELVSGGIYKCTRGLLHPLRVELRSANVGKAPAVGLKKAKNEMKNGEEGTDDDGSRSRGSLVPGILLVCVFVCIDADGGRTLRESRSNNKILKSTPVLSTIKK
jgi:hypothetical protein